MRFVSVGGCVVPDVLEPLLDLLDLMLVLF